MGYTLGFDGIVTAELEKLLQSIEHGVNGFHLLAQTSDSGASMMASGASSPDCPNGPPCDNGVKYGHDGVVIALAIVGGAVAGFIAGKQGAKSSGVKSGHD